MAMTRRHLIRTGSMVGVTALAPGLSAPFASVRRNDYHGPVLVNVFLRGGADGLQMAPPLGDPRYFDLRPNLALAPPGSGSSAAIDLDGTFGLHPALAPLMPLWDSGRLALVHAVGNPADSYSHFDCQDFMERGRAGRSSDATGWLGRHLATTDTGNRSTFRALAVGPAVQTSLVGEVQAFGIEDAESFSLALRRSDPDSLRTAMLALYDWPDQPLDRTTRQVFDAMDTLGEISLGDSGYPASDFGRAMRTLAGLIRADLGVEVASVDSGGWDHHDNLAAELGARLSDLAAGLAAFVTDLGTDADRVTIVVMTEFGRRAAENASLGTDHGHGGLVLTLGADVNGGRVFADWPTLEPGALYGPGDLQVTTDYRLVLGELLAARFGSTALGEVFPNFDMPAFRGIFRPRM